MLYLPVCQQQFAKISRKSAVYFYFPPSTLCLQAKKRKGGDGREGTQQPEQDQKSGKHQPGAEPERQPEPEQPEQKQPLTVLRDTGLRMLSGSCIFYRTLMYRPLHVFCFHAMLLPKIPHYRISIIRKERHAGLPLILAARNAARRSAAHNVHLHAARCGAARRAARRRCNGACRFLLRFSPRSLAI